MTTATKSAPRPDANESFERYTVRAHKALLPTIPDPDERNEAVWSAWRDARGGFPGEDIAARTFDPARYSHSAGHCQFAAHETIGRDGTPRKYGLGELTKIVRQHNSEILDRQAFPSIAEHHTPDPDDEHGKEPAVLGHAGNFRLGMIGREKPTWAVFSDEFHHADAVDTLRKKPFRSVELWTFKDGRMRFHPIAAVGAEAPRLLLPAKYTQPGQFSERQFEGATVEKYTVGAVGAMPGGGNTFIKGEPEKYGSQAGAGTMAPEDIAAIMQALQSTPEFQWLRRAMEEDQAFDDPSAEEMGIDPAEGDLDDAGQPGMDAMDPGQMPEIDDQITPPGGDGDDMADLIGEDDANPPTNPEPAEDEPDEKMTANAADAVSVEKYTQLVRSHRENVEKYTALKQSHDNLLSDHKKLLARVEQRETDAARAAAIDELAGKFPDFVDAEDEKKATLYSLGANVSDDEFANRVALVEKYAEKAAMAAPIPRGHLPERYTAGRGGDVEKYEQRLADEAMRIHSVAAAGGKHLTYDECRQQAEQRIKSNGHATAGA